LDGSDPVKCPGYSKFLDKSAITPLAVPFLKVLFPIPPTLEKKSE
jgi:hypothetical protein